MRNRKRSETPAVLLTVVGLGGVCVLLGAIAAWRGRWICDDAYISFRYARNLVDGLGLVFNAGERVEGYTNFLWTVWSAAAIRLGIEPRVWSQVWGIASYVAAIVLLVLNHLSLRKALGITTVTLPTAAVIAALHEDWIVYATGGLETACFAFLALVGFLLLTGSHANHQDRTLAAGLVFGLLALTRPDGILFAAVAGLFVIWNARCPSPAATRAGLRFAGGFLAIWLPYTIWRVAYYGDFFPNTYYAKSAGLFWIDQGWIYTRLFFAKYWILLVIVPVAWIAVTRGRGRGDGVGVERGILLRQTVLATGFVLVYTAYVVKVGGDFMFGRFLIPVVPFLAVLADVALLGLARRSGLLQIASAALVALALFLAPQPISGTEIVHGIVDESRHYPPQYLEQVTHGSSVIRRYLEGLDASIAFTGSEARLVYESEVARALECETGLTDRTVARQPLTQRGRVGHEKHADIEYVVGERKTHFAFKPLTLQILGAGGRIPDSRILFPAGGDRRDRDPRAFVLHWDPELMAELKRRGAIFRDFPTDLDKIAEGFDRLSTEEIERIYGMSKLFYFDHVDDPRRRQLFEDRLRPGN